MKVQFVPSSRAASLLPLAAVLLSAACARPAQPASEARAPVGDCALAPLDPSGSDASVEVRWLLRSAHSDRAELDQWCRGVGAPIVARSVNSGPARVDSLAVITWNVHLGAARIDEFVAGLRSGLLTGRPVDHFVLLLQEVRRTGRQVPAVLRTDARGARRLGGSVADSRADIVATSARLGLHLFYVPSMRNGGRDDAAEDRGNAILASLPLEDLTAIELPLLAQRRVVVAATLPVLDAAGERRQLRVASVHLDIGGGADRPLALFGAARTMQSGALANALDGAHNIVVGGDFNTWAHHVLEGGLAIMQQRFPDFPEGAGQPTFYTAGFWPRRLDHLFLRAIDVAATAPRRIDDRWGSDHHPVFAWIRF